jgi:phage tail-like protein
MIQQKSSPYSGFNFIVEIDNVVVGGFEEIDGLSAPDTTAGARMPDLHKHTNLTLKRGVLGVALFRVWSSALAKGQPVPGTLKIIPHDKAIQRWTFTNAFPVKYSGPGLKATNNEVSVETIEMTAEGVAEEKECDP